MTVEHRISKEESQTILIDALAQKIAELFIAGDLLVDQLGEVRPRAALARDAIGRWKKARGTAA